jgi:hypothetical protein
MKKHKPIRDMLGSRRFFLYDADNFRAIGIGTLPEIINILAREVGTKSLLLRTPGTGLYGSVILQTARKFEGR